MNHTYRLVYNAALNMFVVASELARGRGKGGGKAALKPAAAVAGLASRAASGLRSKRKPLAAFAALLISGYSYAVPVVYFQTFANGRDYFDTTVNTYKVDSTGTSTTTLFAGLAGGASWNLNGVSITASNGISRTIDDAYLSNAPSLAGVPTGQGINMTASGSDPLGSGLTFSFGTSLNAFGIELGDWGTCCYASSLYIQFGMNNGSTNTWGAAQKIGTANARTDVPEDAGGTYTFIGAINDTNFFNQVRIYGDGNGDVLYAGGTMRTGSVTLNSIPASAGSTTQGPPPDITSGQPATSGDVANGNVNPVLDGGTLKFDTSTTLPQDINVKPAGGTVDINGKTGVLSGNLTDSGGSGGLTVTNTGTGGSLRLTGTNTYSGGTVIDNGAQLIVGDGGTHGSITGDVVDNGILSFARSDDTSFGGAISGTGSVRQEGSGTLTLSGNNSYTGGTTVNGGTVRVASDANLGNASGDLLLNNGTLQTTASLASARNTIITGSGTFNTDIGTTFTSNGGVSGNGNLVKSGAGSMVANGALTQNGGVQVNDGTLTISNGGNTYTGATTIASGTTLALTGNGTIATSSGVTANGTLDIANTTSGASIKTLSGSGAVALGNQDLTLTNASGNFGGTIAGTGDVNVTGGTQTLSGANTYTGGTTIASGTTLALTGNGTIAASSGVTANGTLDIANTAAGASIKTLSGNGTVALGSQDLTLTNASGNFSGAIGGAGDVNVTGGTQTLSGNNTYTGTTNIASGATLALTGNGTLAASSGVNADGTLDIGNTTAGASIKSLSGSGVVALGSQDLTLTNASGIFGGTIGGTGGVNVTGGTQTLSGANTYTGGTSVANGGVRIDSAQSLGDASGGLLLDNGTVQTAATFSSARNTTLAGNGTFATDAGTTFTTTGAIGGNGTLSKDGNGTMVVDGIASHTGGTVVNGGVLVLNGDNTYTGGNTVNSGATLAASRDSNLGDAANNVALNGGTLHATESFGSERDVMLAGGGRLAVDFGKTLTLDGAVSGNGSLSKDGGGTAVLNGVVSHAGDVVVNNGVLALNADNTHVGSNIVNSGATLVVGKDSSLGNQANAVVLNDGGLQAIGSFETDRNIDVSGAGHVGVDAGKTLTASGTVSGSGALVKDGAGALVIDGVASHAGGTFVNGGVLALNGENTYTGGNVVNAGATLQVGRDAALGNASNGVSLNGGTLHATGSFDTARAITVSGAGVVDVDRGAALGVSGPVSGSGALVKNGDGTLTLNGVASHNGGTFVNGGVLALNGDNTYTGGNTVNQGGTLQVGRDAALGNAANTLALNGGTLHATGSFDTARSVMLTGAAQFDTDAGATVTSRGNVAGNGALVKDGGGTLVLNGPVSHAGGNTVDGGTLVLNGTNSYTGGNTVNQGGTLQVASDASLGNAANSVVLDGGRLRTTTTFDTNRSMVFASDARIDTVDSTTLTATGKISGAGRLYKEGSGTLILGGDNINWTGGTTIDAGVVRVTSSTGIGTGDVALNGGMIETTVTLTTGQRINVGGNTRLFTQANTTTTLTGDMQSMNAAGIDTCFIKAGAGTLNMTGTATLRNGTCVQEGVLRANGTLNSVVTVDPGAYLRGSGLITGPVSVSGILAPGNSPGTLTATSTVTMAPTSTFQADINGLGTASGPGNYSRLLITGSGNQLVINNGATLAPNLVAITGVDTYTPYVPAVGDSFRVITAEGGIVGRFAPLAQPAGLAANTRMLAFYNADNSNSLDLRVVPLTYAGYFGSGANSNIRSVSGALDGAVNANDNASASAAQLSLAYAVAGANAAQLPGLAAALSGQVHGALAAVAPLAGQSLQGTVSRQLAGASAVGSAPAAAGATAADTARVAPGQALWADLSANRGRWDGDDSASSFDANRTQLTVGADLAQGNGGRFGAGLSYARTNVSAMAGSGSVEQAMAFVYGEQALGSVTLDGLASFGRSTWNSERSDPFMVAGRLDNDAKGRDSMVSAGIRTPLQVGGMTVEPFARVAYQKSRRDGFQENSATPAALQLSGYDASGTRVMAGLSGGSTVRDPLAGQTTLRYSVGVGRDSGSLVRPEVGASLAGVGTTILSPAIGRSFVQANAEATTGIGKMSYAYFGLAGEARSGKTDLGVTGGVRIRF